MSSINEQLKAAMASLAASDEAPPLAPSKLGTKEHWVSRSSRTGLSEMNQPKLTRGRGVSCVGPGL